MTDAPLNGWLGVELRYLVALRTVADERSFRGAADRLGYAQSAVSQQIARLERVLGVRLVERRSGTGGVKLTEAGDLVCEHADRILAQMRAARTDLMTLREQARETVRVGASQSVATQVVPGVLEQMRRRGSNLRVLITETMSDGDLFAMVQDGELDVAFAELPLPEAPFDHRVLFDDPCVLLAPVESEVARSGEPLDLGTVAALPLIELPGWRMKERIEALFRARGLRLRYQLRSDTETGGQALVSAGLGAAILPRLAVDERDPGVEMLPVDELPSRTIVLYWQRGRRTGAAHEGFREATVAWCEEVRRDYFAASTDGSPKASNGATGPHVQLGPTLTARGRHLFRERKTARQE